MPKLKWIEPSEREIQTAILHFLSYQVGVFAFEITTSARWDPRINHYRKLGKYVMAGTPDIIACVNGLFVGIEVKTSKGRQSPDQKFFQERLQSRSQGYYFIVRSIKDAEDALKLVREDISCTTSSSPTISTSSP